MIEIIAAALLALCYVEAGRLHWRAMLAKSSGTQDGVSIGAAERAGDPAALTVKATFILIWPLWLAGGWLWNKLAEG